MPHVDEGTLHALLDGALLAEEPDRAVEVEAHLRSCPDCRALLEEAAGLRADAAEVLAAAAPAVPATADFADVRARAARGKARGGGAAVPGTRRRVGRSRQLRWTGRIAWAASLVLALGTGYLLRDLVGPAATPQAQPMAESAESARQRAVDGAEPAADADAPSSSDVEAAVPTPAPPPAAAGRDFAGRTDETEAAGSAGVARGTAVAGDRALGLEPVVQEELTVTGAAAPGAAEKARMEAAAALRSRPPVMSRSAEGSGVIREEWLSVTLAEARTALGGPVYRLPRARIEEMYVGVDAAAPRVLTLQRLESGVPVRVVQRPGAAEAAPGTEEAAPVRAETDPTTGLPAPEVARVTIDRYVLEVTGSLPVELLAILAESASPAP